MVTPRALDDQRRFCPRRREISSRATADARACRFRRRRIAWRQRLSESIRFCATTPISRTDRCGGSALDRARLVARSRGALVERMGRGADRRAAVADRSGTTTSPTAMRRATFAVAIGELEPLGLGYVHVVEPGDRPDRSRRSADGSLSSAGCGAARSSPTGPMTWRAPTRCCGPHRGPGVVFRSALPRQPRFVRALAGTALRSIRPTASTLYGGGTAGYADYPAWSVGRAAWKT